jgi:C4-type Zn-finger protein
MPNPPTIAHLQSDGVAGAWVTCHNPVCLHSTPMSFNAIGLAPETPFPAIARMRRFVCAACGSRRVDVTPDWRGRSAAGIGR